MSDGSRQSPLEPSVRLVPPKIFSTTPEVLVASGVVFRIMLYAYEQIKIANVV